MTNSLIHFNVSRNGYILHNKIHANRLKTYFDRKTTKQMRENKKTTKIQERYNKRQGAKT